MFVQCFSCIESLWMAMFVQQLLSVFCVSIVLQFILIKFSMSMSGMPNKACHFLELQRSYTSFVYYCVLFLLYTCPIVLSLFHYTFLIECSYFWLLTIVLLLPQGNVFFYKCKGIMFPSLPSTLFGTCTIIETWWDNVFRFAVCTDHVLWKIMEFIFTMSIWSSSL